MSRLHVLATTDFCTPGCIPGDEKGLGSLSLLINFDLPLKREALTRRLRGFLGVQVTSATAAAARGGGGCSNGAGAGAGAGADNAACSGSGRARPDAHGDASRKKPVSIYFFAANELGPFRNIESFTGGCVSELISFDVL